MSTRSTITIKNSNWDAVKKYYHHRDWYLSNIWFHMQFAIRAGIDEFNYEEILNSINIIDKGWYFEIPFTDVYSDTEYNYTLMLAKWDPEKKLWDSSTYYKKPLSKLIIEKKWWEDVTDEDLITRFELPMNAYTEYTRDELEEIDRQHPYKE